MYYDTLLTKLSTRKGEPDKLLWIEDTHSRLTRHGFHKGVGYVVTPRAGIGVVITPSALARHHVSSRRGAVLLSYEKSGLCEQLGTPDVRIRICVKSIVLMPRLRIFNIARPIAETWSMRGMLLSTPTGDRRIDTRSPLTFRSTPRHVDVEVTESNVVFVTEVLGNAKPAAVRVFGDELMGVVTGQFLAAAGYSKDGDIWRR